MKIFRDIVRPTIALVIISMFVSGIVAVVYNITKVDEVEGMSEKTLEMASEVMGTADLKQISNENFSEGVIGAAITSDGEYVISSSAKGYNSDVYIELVVGFDSDDSIKGISFVNSAETPGIGDKVTESDDFIKQFIGLSGEISLGEQVDGISGATLSSKGTAEAINIAVANLELAKKGIVEGEGN